jgi:hypothetical protein
MEWIAFVLLVVSLALLSDCSKGLKKGKADLERIEAACKAAKKEAE